MNLTQPCKTYRIFPNLTITHQPQLYLISPDLTEPYLTSPTLVGLIVSRISFNLAESVNLNKPHLAAPQLTFPSLTK